MMVLERENDALAVNSLKFAVVACGSCGETRYASQEPSDSCDALQ